MRFFIFRNDAEGLHAYTNDQSGQALPISLGGMGWQHCGFIANVDKAFPTGQAQAIRDVVLARGFYLFKLRH